MQVTPTPTITNFVLHYGGLLADFFLFWLFCRALGYIISIAGLILLIKYSAYIPSNPNYRRNYDDIKTAPANPFTEAPKFYPRKGDN